jgi:hypothetical protein
MALDHGAHVYSENAVAIDDPRAVRREQAYRLVVDREKGLVHFSYCVPYAVVNAIKNLEQEDVEGVLAEEKGLHHYMSGQLDKNRDFIRDGDVKKSWVMKTTFNMHGQIETQSVGVENVKYSAFDFGQAARPDIAKQQNWTEKEKLLHDTYMHAVLVSKKPVIAFGDLELNEQLTNVQKRAFSHYAKEQKIPVLNRRRTVDDTYNVYVLSPHDRQYDSMVVNTAPLRDETSFVNMWQVITQPHERMDKSTLQLLSETINEVCGPSGQMTQMRSSAKYGYRA